MGRMWSFLVPSRISALARPGGVVGQTRPTVVWVNQRLNHCGHAQVSVETGLPVGVAQKLNPFERIESVTLSSPIPSSVGINLQENHVPPAIRSA